MFIKLRFKFKIIYVFLVIKQQVSRECNYLIQIYFFCLQMSGARTVLVSVALVVFAATVTGELIKTLLFLPSYLSMINYDTLCIISKSHVRLLIYRSSLGYDLNL